MKKTLLLILISLFVSCKKNEKEELVPTPIQLNPIKIGREYKAYIRNPNPYNIPESAIMKVNGVFISSSLDTIKGIAYKGDSISYTIKLIPISGNSAPCYPVDFALDVYYNNQVHQQSYMTNDLTFTLSAWIIE